MICKVGPVNYEIRKTGQSGKQQVYHVSMLKMWQDSDGWFMSPETETEGSGLSEGPEITEGEGETPEIRSNLSGSQRGQIQRVITKFQDVFDKRPGKAQGGAWH